MNVAMNEGGGAPRSDINAKGINNKHCTCASKERQRGVVRCIGKTSISRDN